MVSKLVLIASLFTLAAAKPFARNMVVRESRSAAPSGFVHSGAAAADQVVKLRIALVQSNPNGLIDALYDVSTPGNALYGQHLTKEEVRCHYRTSFRDSETLTNTCIHRWRASLRRSRRPSMP